MDDIRLARKYARAFMGYYQYYNQDIDFLMRLEGLAEFLRRYRELLFYADKDRYMVLFKIFGFDAHAFSCLLELLESHKRLFLLQNIFKLMARLYREHNGIEMCTIQSSHPLSIEQQEELAAFFERSLGKQVLYTTEIDKSLIAGIRVQGTTFVWEDSIAQRLRLIEQSYE